MAGKGQVAPPGRNITLQHEEIGPVANTRRGGAQRGQFEGPGKELGCEATELFRELLVLEVYQAKGSILRTAAALTAGENTVAAIVKRGRKAVDPGG
jgi:hypothetical protein